MEFEGIDRIVGVNRRKLVLEITYNCNTSCLWCCAATDFSKNKETASISLDTAKSAIDRATASGLDYLLITGGEPTLVKHLPDIIEYADFKGMNIRINTNGWKSNIEYWKKLKNKGLDYVAVSIDLSHNHPQLNKKSIGLDKAVKTAKNLIHLGIEAVIPITPLPTLWNYEIQLYDLIKENYKELGKISENGLCTELILDGKRHYVSINTPLHYNGRTEYNYEFKQQSCPSKVNLEDTLFVRLNPYNEVRVPCGSEEHLKITPYLFVPENNNLLAGIESLESNREFLKFLKNGINEQDITDICDFCIKEYLNK